MPAAVEAQVRTAIAWLKRRGTKANRDGMARYAIPSEKAFGVSMRNIQLLAKQLGRSHDLAAALWDTGWYEARMLAPYVDEPARVTAAQMDRWCRDFDNWAVCDTVCFVLFDRTPHAWRKVEQWSGRRDEFEKRVAFALLWGLTVHDKGAGDAPRGFTPARATVGRKGRAKGVDRPLGYPAHDGKRSRHTLTTRLGSSNEEHLVPFRNHCLRSRRLRLEPLGLRVRLHASASLQGNR